MLLRVSLASLIVLGPPPRVASAIQYEVFIDVATEADLDDLRAASQISEASFEALRSLLQAPVELNRSDRDRLYLLPNLDYAAVDRILEYRRRSGSIEDLGELVSANVLEPVLANALRAFVIIGPPSTAGKKVGAFVRAATRWSGRHDRLPPPIGVQARVVVASKLDLGAAAVVTRNRLHRARWDPHREALSAGAERVRIEMPKLYLHWKSESWEVMVGTYRIGFGQRLTFDSTDQATPNGLFGDYELRRDSTLTLACKRGAGERAETPCPRERVTYVTPDYTWTNRLTGAAVGLRRPSAAGPWWELYLWGSWQPHRLSSGEIVAPATCDDPKESSPECSAPAVFVRERDPGAPASTARHASLPFVYWEAVVGAHTGRFWGPRKHLGVTGFASMPKWRIRGADLDFRESARRPAGGSFGAVGVEGAFGFGAQDFFAELTRTFDSNDGGGFGALVRSVSSLRAADLEVSIRCYDPDFVNPHARPISAPDELGGLRARDEAGARLRATTSIGASVTIRAQADLWLRLSHRALGAWLFGRLDWRWAKPGAMAVWIESRHGPDTRFAVTVRGSYERSERLSIAAQVRHGLSRRAVNPRFSQHDIGAIVSVTARPVDSVRLSLRVRYDYEDVSDDGRLPQTLWSHVDVSISARERNLLRFRYDLRAFLDDRMSTARRVPNPEHWLGLEYVWRR